MNDRVEADAFIEANYWPGTGTDWSWILKDLCNIPLASGKSSSRNRAFRRLDKMAKAHGVHIRRTTIT